MADAAGCHSQSPLSVRHVVSSPLSRSKMPWGLRTRVGRGYSGSGGSDGDTCDAHFVGRSVVPVAPPHCVRFQPAAAGRRIVTSMARAEVRRHSIVARTEGGADQAVVPDIRRECVFTALYVNVNTTDATTGMYGAAPSSSRVSTHAVSPTDSTARQYGQPREAFFHSWSRRALFCYWHTCSRAVVTCTAPAPSGPASAAA